MSVGNGLFPENIEKVETVEKLENRVEKINKLEKLENRLRTYLVSIKKKNLDSKHQHNLKQFLFFLTLFNKHYSLKLISTLHSI